MKALLQRVSRAAVSIDGNTIGEISRGLVVLVGIADVDTEKDIEYLVPKIVNLRIFEDNESKFNLSILDVKGDLLIVSQFTLMADTRKGRRPSFTDAAPPERAEKLFEKFVAVAKETGLKVAVGRFQAHMLVDIQNNGPVTIMLDSRDKLPSP
ncbi:MAG: D-tyrosyl-tRNA(Tyr) deacylase [Dehalococcoidales bacterium]|nr:D-tyrosyl-tRNA(Tyr) deacylase [Dehalococcoidales bacterium]